jgi:hypothetical protein
VPSAKIRAIKAAPETQTRMPSSASKLQTVPARSLSSVREAANPGRRGKMLDKSWRKFKTKNRLDAYGRRAEPAQNTEGEGSHSCC